MKNVANLRSNNSWIRLTWIALFLLFSNIGFSQPFYFTEDHSQTLHSKSEIIDTSGWLFIWDSIELDHAGFIGYYMEELGLGTYDSLGLHNSIEGDEVLHEYYKQYYKGVLVENTSLGIHSNDGKINLIQGKLVDSLDQDISNIISSEDALDSALAHLDLDLYVWEEDSTEEELPIPVLLFAREPGETVNAENYSLCYRIRIAGTDTLTIDTFINDEIYVNAYDGSIEFTRSLISTCNGEEGTGETLIYGTQDLQIRHRWLQDDYILENCDYNFRTKDFEGGFKSWGNVDNVTDDDGNYHAHQGAVTSHWSAGVTAKLYDVLFGMHGFNKQSKQIRITYNNFHEHPRGPQYLRTSPPTIRIGYIPQKNLLDIMAHEWTHGVIHHTSELAQESEPGSLGESFSDIMGKVIEHREGTSWTYNGYSHAANSAVTPDWIHGNDGGSPNRSLENPNSFQHPDTYGGLYWENVTSCVPEPANDNCYVHHNAGVQNHWFYLLQDEIGLEKASKITYRNMVTYIDELSQYSDSRLGSIRSAQDIYGRCSEEDWQTQKAWEDVGIGQANWCLRILGPGYVCIAKHGPDDVGVFVVNTLDEGTITWLNLNNTWTYSISGSNNEILTVTDWGNSNEEFCHTIGVLVTYGGISKYLPHLVCFDDCGEDPLSSQTNEITLTEYPNPVTNLLYLDSKSSESLIFYIYNDLGQILTSGVISEGSNAINLPDNTASGLYFAKIIGTDKAPIIKAFFKK